MTGKLNLKKGSKLTLTKKGSNNRKIHVELGWEILAQRAVDIDLSIFGLINRTAVEDYVIFFNQTESADKGIVHTGDNRVGSSDGGEAEGCDIDFDILDRTKLDELSIIVTIDRAIQRGHNFGKLKESYLKIFDSDSGDQLAQFDLDAEFNEATSIQIGSFVRSADGGWDLNILGMGYTKETFEDIAHAYGL